MKLYYVANNRLPTKRAHGIQITKMCEAFINNGIECELVIPKISIDPTIKEKDILKFYNISTPLKITRLWSLDLIYVNLGSFLNKILFWIQQLSFAYSVRRHIRSGDSIIYSRDQFTLYTLRNGRAKLFWEAHKFPQNINSRFYSKLFRSIRGLVVITDGLRKNFSHYFNNILVAPDAVDVKEFDINISKEKARNILDLPKEKNIAIYIGQLYDWKGVGILGKLPEYMNKNSIIVIVGGVKKDIEYLKEKIPDDYKGMVRFEGYVVHNRIPLYLKASDCVLMTGDESSLISKEYTSPLKMFEYMASGRPIVAQKLPSFMEVLNHQNSVLVEPNNPKSFADGINKVFSEPDFGGTISDNAFRDVKERTWTKRAEDIYKFIQNQDGKKIS